MDEALSNYCEEWEVSNPSLIEQTNTSYVYKVTHEDKLAVLKIYTDIGRADESDGAYFLHDCKGHGVVDVFNMDDDACLLQYIDGANALSLTTIGKDEEATQIIAQSLNKLHSAPIPKNTKYQSLKERMRCLFKYASFDDAPDIVKRASKFAEFKLENQIDISMLHGDMHHENIMQDSQQGWLIIDAKGLIGDRAYDCANALHNPINHPHLTQNKDRILNQADIMGAAMNIHPQRIIDYAYIHGALSSCWTKDDGGHYGENVLKTCKILEPLISKE